jgi:5-methylcytosine-specific restriction endonuclease McrA
MPLDARKYPPNWESEIRPKVLARAEGRCEACGVHNHAVGYRVDGVFYDAYADGCLDKRPVNHSQAEWAKGILKDTRPDKYIAIALTVAHLDHDRENNSMDNLQALCQKCHLDHDRDHNIQTRRQKKQQPAGLPDISGQMSLFSLLEDSP